MNRHLVLPDSFEPAKTFENTRFFELNFSTHTVSGMLQQTQHPASNSGFSFIQCPIVGHISQIRLHITIEDQIGIAYRVMGEQIV